MRTKPEPIPYLDQVGLSGLKTEPNRTDIQSRDEWRGKNELDNAKELVEDYDKAQITEIRQQRNWRRAKDGYSSYNDEVIGGSGDYAFTSQSETPKL